MIESFASIFHLFLDKSKSFGFKTALLISILGFLFFIDMTFSITYDIHISNKLNNLEKIHELKVIYKDDSLLLDKFTEIERRTIERKHYTEYLPFYDYSKKTIPKLAESVEIQTTKNVNNQPTRLISKNDSIQMEKLFDLKKNKFERLDYSDYLVFFDSLRNSQQNNTNKIITKTIKYNSKKTVALERSRFWMFLSSNFFFIFIAIIFLFAPVFSKESLNGGFLVGWFAFFVVLIGIMLFVYWTAFFIPLLFGNPTWNYILNFIIHTVLFVFAIGGLIKAGAKNTKTK